ncbi:MAG: carbohydrate ABC transporter permease [Syntrophobacterales bacterium]|nr:MAG: carbohydrate ABC transporter permease [Syntrophobacterales bacterium]
MKVKKILLYLVVASVFLYCLFPFLWTLQTALKPAEEVFRLPVSYLPETISLENVRDVFSKRPFGRYVLNSFITAGGATALTLWVASIIAFRLRAMALGKAMRIQRWFLVGAILPPALLVIPVFIVMKHLDLLNSYLGLILAYTALNLPFSVWMLHAAFRQLPRELDEAAVLDGFSSSAILYRIILPLSRPTLAVAAVLVFIFCWNEFILALSLMPSQAKYTVPVGVALLSGASVYEIPWGEINAAVAITTVPIILVIAAFQRWIIEGLTKGAVKG